MTSEEKAGTPFISFAGVKIDSLTIQEAINEIEELITKKECSYVVTPNSAHILLLQKDKEFKKTYHKAALVTPDGMSLLWGGKTLGKPLKEKVSGSDLLPCFCKVAAKKGHKLFFLGGSPGTAAKAAENLSQENPGLRIVGTYSPPFGLENGEGENRKIVRMIREAKPDVLFVGLGAPKQEKWIWRYKDGVAVGVSTAVGATFDSIAGTMKRAPKWMHKMRPGVVFSWHSPGVPFLTAAIWQFRDDLNAPPTTAFSYSLITAFIISLRKIDTGALSVKE